MVQRFYALIIFNPYKYTATKMKNWEINKQISGWVYLKQFYKINIHTPNGF